MSPTEHRVAVNGLSLCAFEWHPERRGHGPTVLLAHATGFHARCWDQVVAPLPAVHVVAVDQRGHGRSDVVHPVRWADFGRDLAALACALDLTDLVGVGHSMGGQAMTEAAAAEPGRFRRLLLVDPVIGPPELYGDERGAPGLADGPHPTVRRRNQWASAAEMIERFCDRPPFDAWDPAVLRDYCEYGLRPAPSGAGFVLACPPEFEAEVYMTSFTNGGVHDSVRAVRVPVLVVRAMTPSGLRDPMDFRYSPTWPRLAGAFRDGRDLHLADRTHFLPMEAPALVAGLVVEAIRDVT